MLISSKYLNKWYNFGGTLRKVHSFSRSLREATDLTWFLYSVEWVLVRSTDFKTALTQVKVLTSLTVEPWSTNRVHVTFRAAMDKNK